VRAHLIPIPSLSPQKFSCSKSFNIDTYSTTLSKTIMLISLQRTFTLQSHSMSNIASQSRKNAAVVFRLPASYHPVITARRYA